MYFKILVHFSFFMDKEDAMIVWTIKQSDRVKLKVMVERALWEFGYSPDQQLLATEIVL